MPGVGGDPGDAGELAPGGVPAAGGDPGDAGEPGYGYVLIIGDRPVSCSTGVIVAYTVVVITDVTKMNNNNKISIFPILVNFCLSIYFFLFNI